MENNARFEEKEEKVLQNTERPARLVIKNGWVMCPFCGRGKILKVNPDSYVYNLPRPCKRCGHESIVNIEAPEPASKGPAPEP